MLLGVTCPSLGLCLRHLPIIGLVSLLGLLWPSFGIARSAVIGVAPWSLNSAYCIQLIADFANIAQLVRRTGGKKTKDAISGGLALGIFRAVLPFEFWPNS